MSDRTTPAHFPSALPGWLLFLMATVLLFTENVDGFGFAIDDLRMHNERACDGYEIHLRCPGKDIINVQKAAYGRQDEITCVAEAHEMRNTHCFLPNTRKIIASRCNGNTSCTLMVGPSTFPDPCPDTKKYLNVMYECVPFIIACPGKLRSATQTSRTVTPLMENASWMKDPYQVSDRLYYMGYKKFLTRQLYEYGNIEDMKGQKKPKTFYHVPKAVEGTGFVIYDRSLFFTPESTKKIVRFDLSTQNIEAEMELPEANYDGTSPYSIELFTDIDLAVDENGLWAIYATEYNDGKIVISRLKHHNLAIVKTWTTDYDKVSTLNAFIVCGVLYAVNSQTLKIDYMFNSSSNIESRVDIALPGLTNTVSSIKYNPKDQQLYVWDKKVAITYKLDFKPIIVTPSTTTTTTTMSTRTVSSTTSTSTTLSTSSTIIPPVTPVRRKCEGLEVRGLHWPDTYYRNIAQIKCPGSSVGYAHWTCGGNASNPQWATKLPDFSQCVSQWIRNIQQELEQGRKSAADLSKTFTDLLRLRVRSGPNLSSWDIYSSVNLLDQFLQKATERSQSAAILTGSVLKSASYLLDSVNEAAWNGLGFDLQNQVANQLVNTVEDASFFMAYDMSTAVSPTASANEQSSTQNRLDWPESMVTLGIRVDPIPNPDEGENQKIYDNILWSEGKGNIVKLDTNSVVDALAVSDRMPSSAAGTSSQNVTTTRHLAVVILSFENLGKYMKEDRSELRIVDSRVLTVSAASIKRTTVAPDVIRGRRGHTSSVVNRHQMLDLASPVKMVIKHERTDLKHHVCAFWDYNERTAKGRWSTHGCRRVAGNNTQSICECDHLTSFAVQSSNVPFPWIDDNEETTSAPVAILYIVQDLPILRAGLSISLLCLLIVSLTLFILRRIQSDVNTIHKNMNLTLILTEVVFVCGIDRTLIPDVCGAIAALLHFGLLATFTWAALEAYHLMIVLGDITERRDRWRWYYAIGYGIPTIVVAVSAAVDHDGYGTVAVCWLKTDGNFIWSFIGPCCAVIILCILFLAMTMYRLHLYSVNFSDAPKDKSSRSGVARSCVLMCLLCALWSCGVLWLSNYQPHVTAILFSTLCTIHGIASLVLYCILPREVREQYSNCISRVSKKSHHHHHLSHRHFSNVSGRHPSSHAGTLARDGASTYGGYYTGATENTQYGCTTTLLPSSTAQGAVLAKAAAAMDTTGRSASDMDVTRLSTLATVPRYGRQSTRGHSDGSTLDLMDETRNDVWNEYGPNVANRPVLMETYPHHYEQPIPHICSTVSSGASGLYNHLHENYTNHQAGRQFPPTHGPVSQHFVPRSHHHHYETMDHHQFHDDNRPEFGVQLQLNENGEPKAVHYRQCYDDAQQRTVMCFTAPLRRNHPHDPHSASFPCCNANGDPHYRPSSGSMEHLDGHGPMTRNVERQQQPRCVSNCTVPNSRSLINREYLAHNTTQPFDSPDSDGSIPNRRGHIKMGTTGLFIGNPGKLAPRRQRPPNYPMNKTGRSSDPLSTDQGYDTDSQQQGCRGCGGAHSDTDQPCSPRAVNGPKPTLVVRSVDHSLLPSRDSRTLSPVESTNVSEDGGSALKRRNEIPNIKNALPAGKPGEKRLSRGSASDISDCTSENDREVERIITSAHGSASSSPAAHGDSGAYDEEDDLYRDVSHDKYSLDHPVAFRRHADSLSSVGERPEDEDMINTDCGGRMSVAESVTSWCAHPGSNPRASNSSYGRSKSHNHKKTSDPQVILANARRNHVEQLQKNTPPYSNNEGGSGSSSPSRRSYGSDRTEQSQKQKSSKNYTYTLPGTAATGTKAKIDLKSGGISMITNL